MKKQKIPLEMEINLEANYQTYHQGKFWPLKVLFMNKKCIMKIYKNVLYFKINLYNNTNKKINIR